MLSIEPSTIVPVDALGRLVRQARLLTADAETAGAGLRTTVSAKRSHGPRGEVLWVTEAGAAVGDSDAARGPVSGAGLWLDRLHAALADGALEGMPHPLLLSGRHVEPAAPVCPPEALLHAVVPATHVAVTQPDAVMALCASAGGEELAYACFGAAAAWIPYETSGTALARELGRAVAEPGVRLALLACRGLVTWGESEQACYEATIAAARRARYFVAAAARGPRCGGVGRAPLGARERARLLSQLLPVVRRALGARGAKVLALDVSPDVLSFVSARDAPTLAQTGAVCPQQVVHTQRAPLWLDADPRCDDAGDLAERLVRGARRQRALARWEAAAFGRERGAPLDADPRVVLVEGVGMIAAGRTRTDARRARTAYRHAMATIGAVTALDRFVVPSPAECAAFARALRAP
ncbi:MAG: class II aldolase/adducin family protein [Conexibacter sp.]